MDWYANYCLEEFGTPIAESIDSYMDAKDGYSNLGILYSTYDDELGEHDIEVECDLVRGLTIVRADNEIIYCEKTEEFDGADFQSIYDWAVELAKN